MLFASLFLSFQIVPFRPKYARQYTSQAYHVGGQEDPAGLFTPLAKLTRNLVACIVRTFPGAENE